MVNVFRGVEHWQYTWEVIQERNYLNVLFVENNSQDQVTLLITAEFTVERNGTNVTCVTRHVSVSGYKQTRRTVVCYTRPFISYRTWCTPCLRTVIWLRRVNDWQALRPARGCKSCEIPTDEPQRVSGCKTSEQHSAFCTESSTVAATADVVSRLISTFAAETATFYYM